MICNEDTFKIFIDNKCGLISMGPDIHVYDIPNGDFLFFYPSKNKLILKKVVGRDYEMNMPILNDTNEKEWLNVDNNNTLKNILSDLSGEIIA